MKCPRESTTASWPQVNQQYSHANQGTLSLALLIFPELYELRHILEVAKQVTVACIQRELTETNMKWQVDDGLESTEIWFTTWLSPTKNANLAF